jgi:hypothetical protein
MARTLTGIQTSNIDSFFHLRMPGDAPASLQMFTSSTCPHLVTHQYPRTHARFYSIPTFHGLSDRTEIDAGHGRDAFKKVLHGLRDHLLLLLFAVDSCRLAVLVVPDCFGNACCPETPL